MQIPGHPKEFAASASIAGTGAPSSEIKGVSLTGGSDAATATIKEGGSSGTVVLTLKAAANTTVVDPRIMNIRDPYLTLTGTGPVFTANL
jgi:hypothetical protein